MNSGRRLVGVVDIGTNSMRMLITDGETPLGRWEEITGLGRGVDRTGQLSEDAIRRSLDAFARFGELMRQHRVERRAAMATSASRDASNREEFFDRAEMALGFRPRLISGAEEARYAYSGATKGWAGPRPWVVSDIGGGSTEFVTVDAESSIDMGSVRLTERWFDRRPVTEGQLRTARADVASSFAPMSGIVAGSLLGVGGSWMEMGGLVGGPERDVDHAPVTRAEIEELVSDLAALTVEETRELPTLNPKRAETILAGAVIAAAVMESLSAGIATQSVADTLDGLAQELVALT